MKARVCIETTVVSYYTARPSRDVVIAGHQQITREWWEHRLPLFDAFISTLVLEEASRGNPQAAKARLAAIDSLLILEPGGDVGVLASSVVGGGLIPREYVTDALHVALASVHRIDYMVTWNCKHLANAMIRTAIEKAVAAHGYRCPTICTPEELMEDVP